MKRLLALLGLPLLLATDLAVAADGATRPLNWTAIGMFLLFVLFTLGVTRWAARRTRSASDFYTAGGGMTGFQNGLAIAGDMISAASFLGISAMMFLNGYDGLLYALGVLAGWPIILFLIAERLRNLGKYTFADVVSYRLEQTPVRLTSAFGTLTVALMYLVAQMVGAGKLIELLFGIDYLYAVMLVGVLMVFYVTFGGMLATTWVQIIKAVMLLAGTTFMAFMVLKHFGFSTEAMFAGATAVHAKGTAIMAPGGLLSNPIDAISLGLGMMFGTAGLPHILMRFFHRQRCQGSAQERVLRHRFHWLLLLAADRGRLWRHRHGRYRAELSRCCRRHHRWRQHGRRAPGPSGGWQPVPGLHLGSGLRHHPRRGRRPGPFRCLGGVP